MKIRVCVCLKSHMGVILCLFVFFSKIPHHWTHLTFIQCLRQGECKWIENIPAVFVCFVFTKCLLWRHGNLITGMDMLQLFIIFCNHVCYCCRISLFDFHSGCMDVMKLPNIASLWRLLDGQLSFRSFKAQVAAIVGSIKASLSFKSVFKILPKVDSPGLWTKRSELILLFFYISLFYHSFCILLLPFSIWLGTKSTLLGLGRNMVCL